MKKIFDKLSIQQHMLIAVVGFAIALLDVITKTEPLYDGMTFGWFGIFLMLPIFLFGIYAFIMMIVKTLK